MMKLIRQLLENKKIAIFITIFIFVLCTIPSKELPKTNDKTAHFIAFGTWAICWFFAFKKPIKALIYGCFFGVFIEIWQYFLPESFHRGFELLDILADALGVLIGIGISYILKKI